MFQNPRRNLYIPVWKQEFKRLEARDLVVTLLYGAFYVSLSRLGGHVVTLVVELFTLAQPHLNLYHRPLEVYGNRYQRKPLLLYLAQKLHYLLFVEQQLPDPHWVAVEDIAVVVGRDVHALYPKLAVVDRTPAVLEVYTAAAYGLDLRAHKLYTRLVAVKDKIFVPRLAVFGDSFERSFIHNKRPFLHNVDTAVTEAFRRSQSLQQSSAFGQYFIIQLFLRVVKYKNMRSQVYFL